MDKLAALKKRYLAEEAELIREAFEATGWSLRGAARWLEMVNASALQRALARHKDIEAERQQKQGGE